MTPGELIPAEGEPLVLNEGLDAQVIEVSNTG